MELNEKVAYIKGLIDGLKLDDQKDEVKVLKAIVEILDDVAFEVSDLMDQVDELTEQIDAVDTDLAEVEDVVFDDDECGCGHHHDDWDDENFYEVTCPSCGEEICVDEDTLLCGEIECPNCSEQLEFDFSELKADNDEAEVSEEKADEE